MQCNESHTTLTNLQLGCGEFKESRVSIIEAKLFFPISCKTENKFSISLNYTRSSKLNLDRKLIKLYIMVLNFTRHQVCKRIVWFNL